MPVFETWVLPCTHVFIYLSIPCVSNHKIILVAKLLELKIIAVCVTYTMQAERVPSLMILLYFSVQITKQNDLINVRNTEKHLS